MPYSQPKFQKNKSPESSESQNKSSKETSAKQAASRTLRRIKIFKKYIEPNIFQLAKQYFLPGKVVCYVFH
jgi:hypothetical protein